MEFWVTQLFNGVSYGALLFLLGGGLTLIFGMMRIVNMTHGSHYLFGCYVAVTVLTRTGSYLLAMAAAIALVAVMGVIEWEGFLKGFRGQEQALAQVLTTMGLALIFQDLALLIWGGDPQNIRVPALLSGRYQLECSPSPSTACFSSWWRWPWPWSCGWSSSARGSGP